jgi:hypothetical protein
MEKGTEKMTPAEVNPTEAENELEALRKELAEERFKTDALSRRCILLGKALEQAQTEANKYADAEAMALVNGRHYHLQALEAAQKRRRAREEKAIAAYEKACNRNAILLCITAIIGFTSLILGFTGFIHPVFSALMEGVSLLAFGWLLNDCVYLLGRCDK